MGGFDDAMWDLNPNTNTFMSLQRPRSINNSTSDVKESLFSAGNTAVKKRSKTFHIYGMDNAKIGNDFLDIISRSKQNSKDVSREPLQEKNMNVNSLTENGKKLDLLDINLLLSLSQSQKTIPIEEGINLLQDKNPNSNVLVGLAPGSGNECEMDALQSQISTVSLNLEQDNVERSDVSAAMGVVTSHGNTTLCKSSQCAGDEESVADSEEEPELLSTILSSQPRSTRSSTAYGIEVNQTLNTSIIEGQEKCVENDSSELLTSKTQLKTTNIETGDDSTDALNDLDKENHIYKDLEVTEALNRSHSENHQQNLTPLISNIPVSGPEKSELFTVCNERIDNTTDNKEIPSVSENQRNTNMDDSAAKTNIQNKPRKRKPSLADICSKTNRARLPPRVGLSKKVKIDSLHNYLHR